MLLITSSIQLSGYMYIQPRFFVGALPHHFMQVVGASAPTAPHFPTPVTVIGKDSETDSVVRLIARSVILEFITFYCKDFLFTDISALMLLSEKLYHHPSVP